MLFRIVIAVAALVAAGCSGRVTPGQSTASPEVTGTVSVTASSPTTTQSTTTTTSETAPSPSITMYQLLDIKALTGALLPRDALPAGYGIKANPTPSPNLDLCDYKPPTPEQFRVRRDFQKGGGLSTETASVTIRQFNSAEDANAAFDALEETISTCKTDTVKGEKLTYSQINIEPVGERSIGVRAEGPPFLLQGFSLVGPSIVSGGAGGLTNANADVQAEVLQKQVERYQEVAGS